MRVLRHRRVRLHRLRRRPRAHRRRPPGRRASPARTPRPPPSPPPGAEVHRGTLDDLDSLRAGAAASDGVIHLAFIHDFSAYEGAVEGGPRRHRDLRRRARGLRPATRHRLRHARGRSGAGRDRAGRAGCPPSPARPRSLSERTALALASRGVRSSVGAARPDGPRRRRPRLRRHGWSSIAREQGVSGYIGDGSNRWPAVHRLDAARLFRLAARAGSRRFGAARCRRGGRTGPRHRRGDRPPSRPPGRVDRPRGRRRALRLARPVPRLRQPRPRAR